MAYKVLAKISSKPAKKPTVSITKDSLRFNKAAVEEFELAGFGHAELHQEEEDVTKLAIKLLKEESADSNKISRGAVSAMAWIKPYKLPEGTYELKAAADGQTLEFTTAAAA